MNYSFEPAARRGEEPSDDLSPAEIVLYERLRTIYALLGRGLIDAESAKRQKEQAERKYREMDCIWTNCERMNDKNIKLWRNLEQYSSAYRMHDRQDLTGLVHIADDMMKTVYGLLGV